MREHVLHHYIDTDTSTWQDYPRAVHPVYGGVTVHDASRVQKNDIIIMTQSLCVAGRAE